LDNLPRLIFYLSGLLLISSGFTLLTTDLLPLVNNGTITGTIIFFVFGLVYMGMVSSSSKRYMRRLEGASNVPYVFAIFIFLPPAIWVSIYEGGTATPPTVYIPMLLVACGAGAYFGHRLGLKAQVKFQENLKAYIEQNRRLQEEPGNNEENSKQKDQSS